MIGLPRPARSHSVSVAGIVWVLLAIGSDAEAASDAVREAIRAGLPSYDSNLRASSSAKTTEPPPNDGAAAYGVKPNDVPASPTPPRTGETLALPRMTVRARQDGKPEPALQLPRIVVRPPAKNLPPEEFETPAARDARLVKKHLNAFDRLWLNRFTLPLFGVTKEQRAREAEAVEQTARQLDDVATILEIAQKENGDDEEAKKLKELYREVFMARPMGEVRGKRGGKN
jgi:hypothetical protein